MKSIAIRRTILILLVVITWTTFIFAFESRELLFNDRSVNGETTITLRIVSDVDIEHIKEMVYQASQQKVQSIDIQVDAAGSKEAIVRMAYMDTNRRQELVAKLQKEYEKNVEVLSAVSIGGSISLEVRYKIFAAIGIAVATIFVLLVLYVRAIKSGKRD